MTYSELPTKAGARSWNSWFLRRVWWEAKCDWTHWFGENTHPLHGRFVSWWDCTCHHTSPFLDFRSNSKNQGEVENSRKQTKPKISTDIDTYDSTFGKATSVPHHYLCSHLLHAACLWQHQKIQPLRLLSQWVVSIVSWMVWIVCSLLPSLGSLSKLVVVAQLLFVLQLQV